ncbi:uncharacterized protein LOC103576766 [Microplitis demolitor]|uniref:uncharacterized protein LOC103576766 n=1 Tax=Microplitis demolitor TaxID=69319 RepID=UPI0004CD5DEC|nr:uncharacterized protein LOC103576766 [Microplitis demolitor]
MISQTIFLLGFFLLGLNCHAEDQEPKVITPWTLIYAVQPYYQSEALVNLWQSEKSLKLPEELLPLSSSPVNYHQPENKSNVNGTVSDNQLNVKQQREFIPPQHLNKEIGSEITYWPPRNSPEQQRRPVMIPRYFDSI